MVLVTEFSLAVDAFALADTLEAFPEVTVESDRLAAHSPGVTMPSFWATGDLPGDFDDAIASDPTVETLESTSEVGDDRIYYVRWVDDVVDLVERIIDHEGVILEATGGEDEWRLRIRFLTRDQVQDFQSYFDERGPTFRLERLFEPRRRGHRRGDLTPEQFQALSVAADAGYFGVPRQTSIEAVAEELGISHQAASERLRRGTDRLIDDSLGA